MGFGLKKRKNEYNYFDAFEKNGLCSLECAQKLLEITGNYDKEKLKEDLKNIHNIEHKADDGKHDMLNYLLKDFLPPIEREDILNLAQKIDDVTDSIEEVLISIDMFNIDVLRKETEEFVELVIKCCESEAELLKSFKNFKDVDEVKKRIIEINVLEEEGDRLYTSNMRKLYRDGTDVADVIKWSTIFNCFENCFDMCEDVADAVEAIMLKNL